MTDKLISKKQREMVQTSYASDIESQNKVLMKSLKKKLNEVPRTQSNCSIFRVPERLRKVNADAYTPQLVSIGPLHHGKGHLKDMEKHKWQYMRDLICRTPNPDISLEEIGKSILGCKQKAIDSYEETIHSENGFMEMMLVDGCFILEVFLKYSIKTLRGTDDPLFNTSWMITSLKRDLLLLENQIPFIVLESLFSTIVQLMPEPLSNSLVEFSFSFFNLVLRLDVELLKTKCSLTGTHLLDLVRNSYLPPPAHEVHGKERKEIPEYVHCATELRRAGIKFRKSAAHNLFDIKFSKGVLEIPAFRIQDTTEAVFRNMIALEQCSHGCTHLISSYAVFMDSLINTAQDVELLQHKRIIANYLGGEEQIAALFNNICNEVVVKDFYFSDLSDQVDAYYKARWHVWKATLKRDYFSNPWAIISVVAAVFLLGLTVLQSVYTVMSYYPH